MITWVPSTSARFLAVAPRGVGTTACGARPSTLGTRAVLAVDARA